MDPLIKSFMILLLLTGRKFGSADFTITMGAYTPLTTEVTTGEIWKIHGLGKACWNLKEDVAVTGVGNADGVVASGI